MLQLLGGLDGLDFRTAVRWLLRYAASSRPAGRLVSVQLLGRILTDGSEITRQGEENEEEEEVSRDEGPGDQQQQLSRRRRHNSAEIRTILQALIDSFTE